MTVFRKAPKIRVFLDDVEHPDARVHTIFRGIGAARMDYATFELSTCYRDATKRTGHRFEGVKIANLLENRRCVIDVPDRLGFSTTLHVGKVFGASVNLGSDGDTASFQSRMEPHLFGVPLSYTHYAILNDTKTDIEPRTHQRHDQPVFNPLYDNRIVPNMWEHPKIDDRFQAMVDPQTLPPAFLYGDHITGEFGGATRLDSYVKFWTLPDCIRYLCWTLNWLESDVLNPTETDLTKLEEFKLPVIHNHSIQLTSHLPSALDQLLNRYGFAWHLDLQRGDGKPKIHIINRSAGEPVHLKRQPAGEKLDITRSDCPAFAMNMDASSNAVNQIDIIGGPLELESTWELVPAWSTEHDDVPLTDLDKLREGSDARKAEPELDRVWRDWVLNEGGDYNGVRPGITSAYDLNADFGDAYGEHFPGISLFVTDRRRRFHPTVAIWHDGASAGETTSGVFVEWYDTDAEEWLPIETLTGSQHIQILDRECGIRFVSRSRAAQQLMYRGSPDAPKLRVTATVIADVRGNVVKGIPMGQSFLSDRKTRILDLDERFRFRLIGTDSVFKARVTDGTLQSSETIPIGPMNDLAESLLDKWTLMTIDGGVTVEGVDHTEAWDWLGKSLAGLEGMDTNFETTHDSVGATNPKYPSIVGITYNIDSQTTDLALETFYPQRAV